MDSFARVGSGHWRPCGQVFWVTLALLAVFVGLGNAVARAAIAPPSQVWQTDGMGPAAGQTDFPRGIAVGPTNGHIYLANQFNYRIDEFTAWGRFIKAWGWDVVQSGPGDTGAGFEICVLANGDTCKSGQEGSGTGQVDGAQGIALDSSGNVYLVDRNNRRIQKFAPTGHFILMFGAKVNRTKVEAAASQSQQNVCPVDLGDVCQAGATGGGASSEFGSWVVGSFITIDSADKVYVGDENRIQRFNTVGAYQGEIGLPGKSVQSLAADAVGNLYVVYADESDVHKIGPAGELVAPVTFPVVSPKAVTVDLEGNVYTFDQSAIQPNNPLFNRSPIIKFDMAGNELVSFGKDEFSQSTGLATNFCAGSDKPGNFYVTNLEPSFLRVYGTPPIGCEQQELKAPKIKAQFAASVATDSALLKATINPEFWPDTTYLVEYGTGQCTAGWCNRRAPIGNEASLGGGVTNADLTTSSVFLSGLSANTTYYYRFVARSSGGGPTVGTEASFATLPLPIAGKMDCPNQVFRTGSSAALPDCRAFEMVSPIDKNGSGIETALVGGNLLAHAALDQSIGNGEEITYSSKQAFGDAVGAPYSSQYVAHRNTMGGWLTDSINALREGFPRSGVTESQALDTEFKAFTEDLTQSWLIHEGEPPLDPPCSPPNSPDLYRRDNLNNTYEALHCRPNKPENGPSTIELQGFSQDGCHSVFRSNSKLTVDARPSGPYQLYESSCKGLSSPDGPLKVVSVRPNGTTCGSDSSAGSALPNVGGVVGDGRGRVVKNAFSFDAKRLYWECAGTLYLRGDPDPSVVGEAGESVVEVAKPEAGEASRFEAASHDGGRMLFISYEPIGGNFQLRSYEPEAAVKTTMITPVFKNAEGRTDLLGASEDAKRAYLVSGEALTADPNSEGGSAVAGKPNLFFHEEGGGFDFIGTFSNRDVTKNPRVLSPVHPLRYRRASRVSPDGLHAAFISSSPMTGYDNTDAQNGEADAEVFVYDASAKELNCVSCNPSGGRPTGRNISGEVVENLKFWAAAWIPGWTTQLYPGRPLSADGKRLFFNSVDPLVNRDTNGAQDVYEWEAASSKDECLKEIGAELYVPSAAGCISLISTGQDPNDSEFVDADRDASDVFIRTAESLVVQDPGLTDIYDARVNGGFPPPPAPAPECEGEACQSPPAPPSFTGPASSNYVGPPNPKPKKACPKGKKRVKSKGKSRCVPRKGKKQGKGKGKAKQREAQRKHGRAGR